jgi:hypothetical protein
VLGVWAGGVLFRWGGGAGYMRELSVFLYNC